MGFPGGASGKEPACQCRRPGFNPWAGKIPWRNERLPTPVFWPGAFHGLYNPWGHKEQLSLSPTFHESFCHLCLTFVIQQLLLYKNSVDYMNEFML